jgi:hypothetical protein
MASLVVGGVFLLAMIVASVRAALCVVFGFQLGALVLARRETTGRSD